MKPNRKPKLPCDPTKPDWSIMTLTRGGTLSIVKSLTLREAEQAYERLDPQYGWAPTQRVIHRDHARDGRLGHFGWGGHCSDSDIEIKEVFGPPGWDGKLNVKSWPDVHWVYTDADGNILPDDKQTHPDRAAFERDSRAREIAAKELKATEPPTETETAIPKPDGLLRRLFSSVDSSTWTGR